MINSLNSLIAALRDELQQHGEQLALLEQQRELITARAADQLLRVTRALEHQTSIISGARELRARRQRDVARRAHLSEDAGLAELLGRIPEEYRPLLQALVEENDDLLGRTQERTHQNHVLLARSLELTQRASHSASILDRPAASTSPRREVKFPPGPRSDVREGSPGAQGFENAQAGFGDGAVPDLP